MRPALLVLPAAMATVSCAAGSQPDAGQGGNGATGTVVASSRATGPGVTSGAPGSTAGSGGAGGHGTTAGSGGAGAGPSTSASSGGGATATSSVASGTSGSGGAGGTDGGAGGMGGMDGGSPVAVGSYFYKAIPAFNLIDPPAAAWHPSGSYALVLNADDTVFRYDPAGSTLTQVASVGATVTWRAVRFTPDGTKAVLLGNVYSGSNEGEIFVWDDATSTLTPMPSESFAGGTYEAIAWSPAGTTSRLLGSNANGGGYVASLWHFDPVTGRSGLKAQATAAGCEDLAWATDGFNLPAVAVTCGVNGVALFYLDEMAGAFVNFNVGGSAGNTARIAARPQGDYALAVGWSSSQVWSFAQGAWHTGFNNPTLPGAFTVDFSTDGRRALILGGYGGAGVGQVYEFRDDLMAQADFTDVSIPGFALPPYNAVSGVTLNQAAWRPGCEGGLLVGGLDTFAGTSAYVIEFAVTNGIACP